MNVRIFTYFNFCANALHMQILFTPISLTFQLHFQFLNFAISLFGGIVMSVIICVSCAISPAYLLSAVNYLSQSWCHLKQPSPFKTPASLEDTVFEPV